MLYTTEMIILTGNFAIGWSRELASHGVIGTHPDIPHDPCALLLHRYQAYTENPDCIVTSTLIDTIDDPLIEEIVTELAAALFPPEMAYTYVTMHANQHEFFETCIQQGYTKTFHQLQEIRMSPGYFQTPQGVDHVYVPPYATDTPDSMRLIIDRLESGT